MFISAVQQSDIYSFFRLSSYRVLSRVPCIILFSLLLGCVQLFGTSWTVACQAPLSSTSPRVCLDSYPLSWWCYLIISSSTAFFSICLWSFPAFGSFLMSQVFKSCGQSIEASATNLQMNIHDWFPLRLTGLISLLFKGLSRVFPSTIRKHQLFDISLIYGPTLTSMPDYWKNHSLDYIDLCKQSDVSAF